MKSGPANFSQPGIDRFLFQLLHSYPMNSSRIAPSLVTMSRTMRSQQAIRTGARYLAASRTFHVQARASTFIVGSERFK